MIEALKRIFVIQLVQKIIVTRKHNAMKKRLEKLKIEFSSNPNLKHHLSADNQVKELPIDLDVKVKSEPVLLAEWEEPLVGQVYERKDSTVGVGDNHMFTNLVDELEAFQCDDSANVTGEDESIIKDIIEKMLRDIEFTESASNPRCDHPKEFVNEVVWKVLANMVDQVSLDFSRPYHSHDAVNCEHQGKEQKELVTLHSSQISELKNFVKEAERNSISQDSADPSVEPQALTLGAVLDGENQDKGELSYQDITDKFAASASMLDDEQLVVSKIVQDIVAQVVSAAGKQGDAMLQELSNIPSRPQEHFSSAKCGEKPCEQSEKQDNEQSVVKDIMEGILERVQHSTQKSDIQTGFCDIICETADEEIVTQDQEVRIPLHEDSNNPSVQCPLPSENSTSMDVCNEIPAVDLYDEVFSCHTSKTDASKKLSSDVKSQSMDSTHTDDLYGDLEDDAIVDDLQIVQVSYEKLFFEEKNTSVQVTCKDGAVSETHGQVEDSDTDDERLVINESHYVPDESKAESKESVNATDERQASTMDVFSDDEDSALVINEDVYESETPLESGVALGDCLTETPTDMVDQSAAKLPAFPSNNITVSDMDDVSNKPQWHQTEDIIENQLVGSETSNVTPSLSVEHLSDEVAVCASSQDETQRSHNIPDVLQKGAASAVEDNSEFLAIFLGTESADEGREEHIVPADSLSLNVLDLDQDDSNDLPFTIKDSKTLPAEIHDTSIENAACEKMSDCCSENGLITSGFDDSEPAEPLRLETSQWQMEEKNKALSVANSCSLQIQEETTPPRAECVEESSSHSAGPTVPTVSENNVAAGGFSKHVETHTKTSDAVDKPGFDDLPPLNVPDEIPPVRYTHKDIPIVLGLRRMKHFLQDCADEPYCANLTEMTSPSQESELEVSHARVCSDVKSVLNHMKYTIELDQNHGIDPSQLKEVYNQTMFSQIDDSRQNVWPTFPRPIPYIHNSPLLTNPSQGGSSPESQALTKQLNMQTTTAATDLNGAIQNICSFTNPCKKTVRVESRDLERMSRRYTYKKLESLRRGLISIIKNCGLSGTYNSNKPETKKPSDQMPMTEFDCGQRYSNRIQQRAVDAVKKRQFGRNHDELKQGSNSKPPFKRIEKVNILNKDRKRSSLKTVPPQDPEKRAFAKKKRTHEWQPYR